MISGDRLFTHFVGSAFSTVGGIVAVCASSQNTLAPIGKLGDKQWTDEDVKTYQVFMREEMLHLKEIVPSFLLGYAGGSLVGNFVCQKLDLNHPDAKKIHRFGVIFTVTALFTFCLTKSVPLTVLNSAITAGWQQAARQ